MKSITRITIPVVAVALLALLVYGCGGGGGSSLSIPVPTPTEGTVGGDITVSAETYRPIAEEPGFFPGSLQVIPEGLPWYGMILLMKKGPLMQKMNQSTGASSQQLP